MAGKRPDRSAGYVGWGLVLMVAGWAVALVGLLNPSSRAFGPDEMSPWVLAGGVGSLLGFVILAIGIHTVAQAVDSIAIALHSTAPATPPPTVGQDTN
jgi:hypothetical protein